MTVSAANRIQSNSGVVTATSSFTASLPNPTTAGSTLMLWVATAASGSVSNSQSFDPPFFFDLSSAGNVYVLRRDSQPAGETSWAIATIAVSNPYCWRAEEWAGWSTIGQPDATTTLNANTGSPVSTNTVTPDVNDFAALAVFVANSTAGPAWPSGRSYSSGWSEVACLTSGTGGGANDFIMVIAESYPGASGSVSCTLTWDTSGGGGVPGTTDSWVACYQPSAPAPPTGILTS